MDEGKIMIDELEFDLEDFKNMSKEELLEAKKGIEELEEIIKKKLEEIK